jgi:hypothetical protein
MQRNLAALGLEDPPSQTAPWEIQWGQLDSRKVPLTPCVSGSIGWVCLLWRPLPVTNSAALRGGASVVRRLACRRFRIVTWLILPVVICLSQRLSHACLSISNYTVKLRMAH